MFRSYYWYRLRVFLLITAVLLSQSGLVVAATDASSSGLIFSTSLPVPTDTPIVSEATLSAEPSPDLGQQSSQATASADHLVHDSFIPLATIHPDDPLAVQDMQTRVNRTRLKRLTRVKPLATRQYRMNEKVIVEMTSGDDSTGILVRDKKHNAVDLPITKKVNGDTVEVSLSPPQQFTPGTYTVTVVSDTGVIYEQDFTWGVLAINMNKAVYAPDDDAHLFIAVLDEQGTTVCDASVVLSITKPDGSVDQRKTDDGSITLNDDCGHLREDGSPDYETTYHIDEIGTYHLTLEATTNNGTYTITDQILVQDSVPFIIERSGPTRIYPPSPYAMTLTVTATESFIGTIMETVPESFIITPSTKGKTYDSLDITAPYRDESGETLSLGFPVTVDTRVVRGFGDTVDRDQLDIYNQGGITAHDGVDYAVPIGTDVQAIDDGDVVFSGVSVYGITVVLDHPWGRSYYGNLSTNLVSINEHITKGQTLGTSGPALTDTPPHVHIGIKKRLNDQLNGYAGKENPVPYLGKTSLLSDLSVKTISWNIALSKGETITLSYAFLAPRISPQFYLLGPLRFFNNTQLLPDIRNRLTDISERLATSSATDTESTLSSQLTPLRQDSEGQATLSSTLQPYSHSTIQPSNIESTPSAQPQTPSSQPLTPTLDFTDKTLRTMNAMTSRLAYEEPRAWQIAADAVPTNARVSTVEYYAGQFTGDGSTGQNSDTNQTFTQFNFQLAETNASIYQAIVVLEMMFGAYTNPPAFTSWSMAFDACEESCTANAWSGTGNVTLSDSTTLAYNEGESNQAQFFMDVTNEATLASYTGGGTTLEGQVGYRVDEGSAANSISSVQAKLVITYSYNATTTNYTNTIVYPLESNDSGSGDQGTRTQNQTGGCTKDSNCPTFSYNVNLGETSATQISQWFQIDYQNDSNNANDISYDVNIEGDNTDSTTMVHECANSGTQQTVLSTFFSGQSGYATDTDQDLEIYTSTGNIYLMGGEVFHTYSAANNSTTKTRTVRYPLGIISNGTTTAKQTASTTVYFPEIGVNVEKAWVRMVSSNDSSGARAIDVTTTVGGNTETSALSYNYNPGGTVIAGTFRIYHVIPSADYTELETATADTGVTVTVSAQANDTTTRGISAELMITYTYSAEYEGYVSTNTVLGGQQTSAPSQSFSASGVDPSIPEYTGVKTIRGATLFSTNLLSDSDSAVSSGPITMDANLATGSCTNSNAYQAQVDSTNAYNYWYEDVTSVLNTDDTQTYTVCLSDDGGGDTSGGTKSNSILIYTYQVDLPSLAQLMRHGKWFDNNGTYQAFTF